MGEIAEALRRAKDERARDRETDEASQEPRDSGRHGLKLPWTDPEPEKAVAAPHTSVGSQDVAHIPREKTGPWPARTVWVDATGADAEVYRHFAIRVRSELASREAHSVMVVSAGRQEGKTTTSCNLALALASMSGERRTALVDFDLRRPSVGASFGLRPAIGVDDVLRGRATLDEARVVTELPRLDVFPVARPLTEPHEHLSTQRLPDFIRQLHDEYQTIVFDSPPLLVVPDAELILPYVGGTVMLVRASQTRRDEFKRLIAMLPPERLLGTFLNDTRQSRSSKRYGYYTDPQAESS